MNVDFTEWAVICLLYTCILGFFLELSFLIPLSYWVSIHSGKISSWIDLDSEDEILRADSETTLKQEISWASHLSLQVCIG